MRKAIGMSGLLAAILAAGPVRAQGARNDYPLIIMPDGTILTDESTQIGQMRQLQRQINGQVQARIARELQYARTPYEIVEIPDGPSRANPDLRPMIIPAQFALAPIATEKAAYMGIATGPVSAPLRDQLKLHRGMGLLVLFVEKGSPAADAGLLQNDILEKLDDQFLINTPQFTILVRSKKPGDEVTLSLIREGQHTTAKIKLAEKEVPLLEDLGILQGAPQFVPIPAPTDPGMQMNFGVPPEVDQPWQHGQRITVSLNPDGSARRHLVNGQYDITLTTTRDNAATLLINDNAGKELFNAPYTTDAEKQKLPPDLAPLVKDLAATNPAITVPSTHAAITRFDNQHRITLQQNGTEKRLTVIELPSNKTLYDGPPDAEEVNTLPPDVLEKIHAVEQKAQIK